jgi:hypothetical protein
MQRKRHRLWPGTTEFAWEVKRIWNTRIERTFISDPHNVSSNFTANAGAVITNESAIRFASCATRPLLYADMLVAGHLLRETIRANLQSCYQLDYNHSG